MYPHLKDKELSEICPSRILSIGLEIHSWSEQNEGDGGLEFSLKLLKIVTCGINHYKEEVPLPSIPLKNIIFDLLGL